MIDLNKLTQTQYVKNLCKVLAIPAKDALTVANLRPAGKPKRGRLPSYPAESVLALESMVNQKVALAEESESLLCERITLARDLNGWTDAELGRQMGVSRELVRRWKTGDNRPTDLTRLAQVLEIPEGWLKAGGSEHLAANSHLGRRVGNEMTNSREALFGETQFLISTLPEDLSEVEMQQAIETTVYADKKLSVLARKCGGRWQCIERQLRFAPWIDPSPLPELQRRIWPDQVEAMIAEELTERKTIYSAWYALRNRCIECGLPYPTKIALYKRQQKRRQREEKLGVRFHLN